MGKAQSSVPNHFVKEKKTLRTWNLVPNHTVEDEIALNSVPNHQTEEKIGISNDNPSSASGGLNRK